MIRPYIIFFGTDWEDVVQYTEDADTPMAIDRLTVQWGRSEYLDEREPSTATITLLVLDAADATTRRLMFHRNDITVRITADDFIVFDGLIREVDARRETRNGRDVYLFTITAVDPTVVFSHRRPGSEFGGWMSTQMTYTANKLRERFESIPETSKFIHGVLVPQHHRDTIVQDKHDDWGQATLHTYLERFYRSAGGLGWDFSPNTTQILPQGLGPEYISTLLAHRRDGLHIEPDIYALEQRNKTVLLDGDTLGVDSIGFTMTPRGSIKTARISGYAYNQSEKVEKEILVRTSGTDSVSLDTMLAPQNRNDKDYMDRLAHEFDSTFQALTRWPTPPAMRYRFTTLETKAEMEYWLSTWYSGVIGVIYNSALLTWLQAAADGSTGYPPPTVVPYNGTVEFDGREWIVTHQAAMLGDVTAPGKPVTFATLNEMTYTIGDYADGTTWGQFSSLPPNNTFKELA